MKIERSWVGGGQPNLYYYIDHTGRIIGETSITGTGNSCKYSCVIYADVNTSQTLGMYISSEYAKQAIERYWSKEDGVYDMVHNQLGM